jgi:hypothetical protein
VSGSATSLHRPIDAETPGLGKALAQVSSLLVSGEKPLCYAVQRRLFALLHRRSFAIATTGRFIYMSRGLLGGFDPLGVRWQDIKEVSIRIGVFGADLRIAALRQPDLPSANGASVLVTATGLRKDQAQAVYRVAQGQEQAWREKRRLRELEELRAKSGGIQLPQQSSAGLPTGGADGDSDPTARLERAKNMLGKGLISDSEYETIKARIVGSL